MLLPSTLCVLLLYHQQWMVDLSNLRLNHVASFLAAFVPLSSSLVLMQNNEICMQFIPHSPIRQFLVPCRVCLSDSSVAGVKGQATYSNVLFIKNEINILIVDEKRKEKEDTDETKHSQIPNTQLEFRIQWLAWYLSWVSSVVLMTVDHLCHGR